MADILEILSEISLFSGLDRSQLAAVRQIVVDRFFDRSQTIFTDGDDADGFYIVADGRVKIFKVSADGKEQIFHIYGRGKPFGEVPVFSGGRFPASAVTLEKSHLLFLPRSAFVRLIADNPSLSMNMMAVLAQRLREFTLQVENLSLKEVPGRLASYLTVLSAEQGHADRLVLTISKGQLASLLGTIPETLSRMFARMTDQGLIDVAGREIHIVDRIGLNELAVHGKLVD